jgi:endoplasmic reticulum-Golgi intermediate compartment protein 3
MSLDAMDVAGQQQLDIEHNLFKRRLAADGRAVDAPVEKESVLGTPLPPKKAADDAAATPATTQAQCGSCYGAESRPEQCCNTCEEVREAYRLRGWTFATPDAIEQCKREHFSEKLQAQKDEGCHVWGHMMVNKVAGNFHVSPGKSFLTMGAHVHDANMFGNTKFDLSHTINSLSFGIPFPGAVNPLDNVTKVADAQDGAMYQYFLKVVPTVYENIGGERISTNQFSVTEHYRSLPPPDHTKPGHEHGLPGVFFVYDISPIMVRYEERRKSFTHFLTGVCAIVGGVFTVAGIVDSLVYHSLRSLQKKVELGKHT